MMSATTSLLASAYCCMYFQSRAASSALGPGVAVAVGGVVAQAIAEAHHPVGFWATGREHVDVDGTVGGSEQAMLEPLGLADAKDVAGRLEVRHVRALCGRVGDLERDVDDRLGRQAGDRGGANVLEPDHAIPRAPAIRAASRSKRPGQAGS